MRGPLESSSTAHRVLEHISDFIPSLVLYPLIPYIFLIFLFSSVHRSAWTYQFPQFLTWYLRELSSLSLSIEEWWATLVYIELCVFMCVSTFRALLKPSPSILRTTARAEFGSEHSLLILSWTHSLSLPVSLSSSKPRSTKDQAFRQTSCLELKLVINFGSK